MDGSQAERGPVEIPRIISVDDHVLEPADIWASRLPAKYGDVGPRVRRERGIYQGSVLGNWRPDPSGNWADVWYYEDLVKPLDRNYAAAGTDVSKMNWEAVTFDQLRPGAYRKIDRLADMDVNHTEASVCFPNTVPRFCGQTFAEAKDKTLALLCVRAYNDWMIDDWCAGEAFGRLIPLTIVPLWDTALAAEEIRRCASKGSHAVSFSENPYALGLPSIHSGEWDEFFAACEETETTICMHIGSSSKMPETSPDAPYIIKSVLLTSNAGGALLDWIFSGTPDRFPNLKLAFSEADVGWMPYLLERMDKRWERGGEGTKFGGTIPRPPSSYIKDRIFGCAIDDEVGVQLRSFIENQICFETDYPHSDSRWPDSKACAENIIRQAGLSEAEAYAFLRGNAIKAFGLNRFGIMA